MSNASITFAPMSVTQAKPRIRIRDCNNTIHMVISQRNKAHYIAVSDHDIKVHGSVQGYLEHMVACCIAWGHDRVLAMVTGILVDGGFVGWEHMQQAQGKKA